MRAAIATALALGVLGSLGAARAEAQGATRRDTTQRDTTRAGAPASRRPAAPLDTGRRALPDSTARDSIVAAQLRASRRRGRRTFLEQFNIDRLRLTELGVLGGVAFPDGIRHAPLYAVRADYGEIVPDFRVVFGITYWNSRYTDDAVATFEQALATATAAPGGVPVPISVGSVRSSDVTLTGETRWRPAFLGGHHHPTARIRPWVGLGAGVHFTNVQNSVIDGTFVSRALDGVALGPTGAFGVDLLPLRAVLLSAEARYDLFNGARYGSLRAGGSYVFEPRRAR